MIVYDSTVKCSAQLPPTPLTRYLRSWSSRRHTSISEEVETATRRAGNYTECRHPTSRRRETTLARTGCPAASSTLCTAKTFIVITPRRYVYQKMRPIVTAVASSFFCLLLTRVGCDKKQSNCRLNAFVWRNINVWNRLPAHVVNSDSVAVFKRRLACVNLVNFCYYGTY